MRTKTPEQHEAEYRRGDERMRRKVRERKVEDPMWPEEMAVFLSIEPKEVLRLLHERRIPHFRVGPRTLRVQPMDAALYRLAQEDGVDPLPLFRAHDAGLLAEDVKERAAALLAQRPRTWPLDVLPTEGWVYLVETTEGPARVKIGFSSDPQRRLADMQVGSPVKLRLRTKWRGTSEDEASLHRLVAAHRLHGEWFEMAAAAEAERIMGARA